MTLSFLEDDRKTIAEVIATLQATGFFEILEFRDYPTNERALRDTDLFVLDVVTHGKPDAFCDFVRTLHNCHKPFLAFSELGETTPLKCLPGKPRLRDFVFEHGGLGLLPKGAPADDRDHPSHQQLRFQLVERVVWFYWCFPRKPGLSGSP